MLRLGSVDDDTVELILGQLEGKPLPLAEAREFCHRKIETLEQRIQVAQRLIEVERQRLDRLNAAQVELLRQ